MHCGDDHGGNGGEHQEPAQDIGAIRRVVVLVVAVQTVDQDRLSTQTKQRDSLISIAEAVNRQWSILVDAQLIAVSPIGAMGGGGCSPPPNIKKIKIYITLNKDYIKYVLVMTFGKLFLCPPPPFFRACYAIATGVIISDIICYPFLPIKKVKWKQHVSFRYLSSL